MRLLALRLAAALFAWRLAARVRFALRVAGSVLVLLSLTAATLLLTICPRPAPDLDVRPWHVALRIGDRDGKPGEPPWRMAAVGRLLLVFGASGTSFVALDRATGR